MFFYLYINKNFRMSELKINGDAAYISELRLYLNSKTIYSHMIFF